MVQSVVDMVVRLWAGGGAGDGWAGRGGCASASRVRGQSGGEREGRAGVAGLERWLVESTMGGGNCGGVQREAL